MHHQDFEPTARRHEGERHSHGREQFFGPGGWFARGFAARREESGDPRCAGRGGFGRRGGWERGFGRGGERLFDAGDIKLVVLKLLSEQPSYGYQLMKTMEQRLGGGYTPSAGVIYPTLTMLEEEGLAVSTAQDNKKVYSVTPQGNEFLQANKERVEQLFARLDVAGRGFRRGRSPELMRAFMNLRGAVAMRLHRENVTAEQIAKIAEAINTAAKTIDEL